MFKSREPEWEENYERETSQRRFNVWNGDVQQANISLLPIRTIVCRS